MITNVFRPVQHISNGSCVVVHWVICQIIRINDKKAYVVYSGTWIISQVSVEILSDSVLA